jgi:hypothetical protein
MKEDAKLPITEERVELSGWDSSGKFFLEIAYLIGLGESEMFAELNQGVQLGAPIFVRRLDWQAKAGDIPAIYQVKAIESRGANGAGCVRLRLLKPIRPFTEPECSENPYKQSQP